MRGALRLINRVCGYSLMGFYACRSSGGISMKVGREIRSQTFFRTMALSSGVVAFGIISIGLTGLCAIPQASAAAKGGVIQSFEGGPASGMGSIFGQKPISTLAKRDKSKKDDSDTGKAEKSSSDDDSSASADHSDKEGKNDNQSASDTEAGHKSDDEKKSPKHDTQTLPKGDAKLGQLLRLWGVFGSEVHSGCMSFNVGDLRCLTGKGDFAALKRYDRPALLVLKNDGHSQTVLLSAINDDGTVTLSGGDDARDVDRDRVEELWTGHFTLIWRSASGSRLIRPGATGKAVVWLRQRLMSADGEKPESQDGQPSPIYNRPLAQKLKAFQKDHGLKPDGIAGPRTQIELNDVEPPPGTPDLTPGKSSSESDMSLKGKSKK